MKKFFNYSLSLLALLTVSTACRSNKKGEADSSSPSSKSENATTPKEKPLIVYFSHAGENYAVGNIKVGNTKLVAENIKVLTGADEFEVIPVKSYDMPYHPLIELAKKEQQNDERPAFKGEIKILNDYKTIFIGTPIWWGTFPQVIFTFFDKYDLNGKTLIPFSTHEGSGLGSIVGDLKKKYPKADVKDGLAIRGTEAASSKETVEKWLKRLGY